MTVYIADLFCGAGGAAMGIHRAMEEAGLEHEIVGFDIKPMPRYPFHFVLQDALTVDLSGFDAVWASPPCQGYSVMRNLPWNSHKQYPMLILPVREMFQASGLTWVIENVEGARHGRKQLERMGIASHGMQAGFLCGTMFGMPFYRHRLFETNFGWLAPGHPKHTQRVPGPDTRDWNSYSFIFNTTVENAQANQVNTLWREYHDGTTPRGSLAVWQQGNGAQADGVGIGHANGWRKAAQAMGIDWMKRDELTQAIPPVYSHYVWSQLIKYVTSR